MINPAISPDLRSQLAQRLAGAGRVAFLAVGSELCGDDAVGLLVARRLTGGPRADGGRGRGGRRGAAPGTGGTAGRRCGGNGERPHPVVEVLNGGSAPENLAGEIRRFHPTHLVVVDAADIGARPGAVALLPRETLRGTIPSTHRPSLELLLAYAAAEVGCQVVVIGIQPRSTDFGSPVSGEVRASAGEVAELIRSSLG